MRHIGYIHSVGDVLSELLFDEFIGDLIHRLSPFWEFTTFDQKEDVVCAEPFVERDQKLLFAVVLGWLPVGGRFPPSLIPPDGSGFYLFDCIKSGDWGGLRGTVRHLILPASTLALLLSGTFTTALRLNLRRTLRSDYVEAARSRGLSEPQVVLRHGLPNALLPVLTIAGITVASLIGGSTFGMRNWAGLCEDISRPSTQRTKVQPGMCERGRE